VNLPGRLPVRDCRSAAAQDGRRRPRKTGSCCCRGPSVFAGYLQERAGDARDPRRGRLAAHRLTVAEIDADGFIRITDRKKDILVTAGGKKVAPQNSRTCSMARSTSPRRSSSATGRPYIAALVALDVEAVGPWAEERGLPRDLAALAQHPRPPSSYSPSSTTSTAAERLRADQALRHPPARLLGRRRGGHAHPQAPPARGRAALRAPDRRAVRRGLEDPRAPTYVAAYQPSFRLEIFTTSPVCGA
jgi:hypothetical protein